MPTYLPGEAVYTYMPPQHVEGFKKTAKYCKAWILIRRGKKEMLRWIGQLGYIPKPGECKAKTADLDFEGRPYAGLVTSPKLVPGAFSTERFGKALEIWLSMDFQKTLYDPDSPDPIAPADIHVKQYHLQLDKQNKHYGCVMYRPYGTKGEYIYSDYDIYAIVPEKNPGLNEFTARTKEDSDEIAQARGRLLTNVQYFFKMAGELNERPDPRPPMIRHGEQETFMTDYSDPLDVFWPDGKTITNLEPGEPIKAFYRDTLQHRIQSPGNTRGLESTGQGMWQTPKRTP